MENLQLVWFVKYKPYKWPVWWREEVGKGISLDLKKGCATYESYMSDTTNSQTGRHGNAFHTHAYQNLS